MKRLSFIIISLLQLMTVGAASHHFSIDLWPGDGGSDTARVEVFLPDAGKATGRAIVICPGGGYTHLSMQNEGTDWAPVFNQMGVAVAVLKYRMPNGDYTKPGQDAEEAIRLLRRNANAWNINPGDVGIMGFSAGGHLASTIATHAEGDARPDFQVLIYPVITMEEGVTHQGSRENLLGPAPTAQLVEAYSNELHVGHDTPPAFIALAHDDHAVPPQNSLRYYSQLLAHHVPASLHVYPAGGHGFGLRPNFPYHAEMLMDLKSWLRSF